jgi:hypothetical protein
MRAVRRCDDDDSSGSHELPASARALAGELLRCVDADGAFEVFEGEEPWEAVARIVRAEGRRDLAWVQRAATQLLGEDPDYPGEGHLEHVAGPGRGRRLRIRPSNDTSDAASHRDTASLSRSP